MTTRQHLPQGVATMPPGAELGCALSGLDPARLSGVDVVVYLQAWFRQHNHAAAQLLRAVREAGLVQEPGTCARAEELDEWSADEARAALAWSRGTAAARLDLADDLLSRLPEVYASMLAGAIDEPKARALSEWTAEVPPGLAEHVGRELLPEAPRITVHRLVQRIQELLRALDPEWSARREAAAERSRRVWASRNPSGTADLAGQDLPLERVVSSMARITSLAAKAKHAGAEAGIGILRADVYMGLLDGSYDGLDDDTIVKELVSLHRKDDGDEPDTGGGPTDPGPTDPGPTDPDPTDPDPTDPDPTDPDPAGPDITDPGPDRSVDPGPDENDLDAIPAGADRWREGTTLRLISRRERIELRVCLSTVLGLDDRPAEIAGWGPVAPDLARRTLESVATAEWRIVIVDDDGHLLHVDLTRRRPRPDPQHPPPRHPMTCAVVELAVPLSWIRALDPADHGRWAGVLVDASRIADDPWIAAAVSPADVRRRFPKVALARWVQVRDRYCVGPGCPRPARACDLDHTLDHLVGGRTRADNLSAACRHDHRMKHHGGWTLTQPEEGALCWRSRSGARYDVPRRPVVPRLPNPVRRASVTSAPPADASRWFEDVYAPSTPWPPGWDNDPHPVPVPIPTSCAAAGYDDVPPF